MALADRVTAQATRPAPTRDIERADPVTLQEFGYLLSEALGGSFKSTAGPTVTTTKALGISAWYRGARWLSENIASLPVHTYRRGRGVDRSRRADPVWMLSPHPEIPWFGIVEFVVMSLLHRGNAYLLKLRNEVGQVVELHPIHPDRVRAGVSKSTQSKVFEVRTDDGEHVSWTTREVLHIPDLSTDGFFGIDPLRAQADTVGAAAAADEMAGRHFSQGSHVSAYISFPGRLDDDEAEDRRKQWEKLHKGVTKAHQFGVLGDGAEYKTISLDPQQMQLLETRKFGVTEIARILGVPPHKLYDLERATFSNIEHQAIEVVTDTVRPRVARLEAHINHDRSLMVPRNFVEWQLEGLLRGDTLTRYRAWNLGIMGGYITPQLAARTENWPAPDEIDYYLRPLNHDVIGDAAGGNPITGDTPDPETT